MTPPQVIVTKSVLEEILLSSDPAAQIRLANEVTKRYEDQSPETRALLARVSMESAAIQHVPDEFLSPELRNYKNIRKVLDPHSEKIARGETSELHWASHHKESGMVDKVMASCPPVIQDIQSQIDTLLEGESRRLDLPALLNAISKHLNRDVKILTIEIFASTEKELSDQLVSLHILKSEVHRRLCGLLVQASLHDEPPHPRKCTCLLCAHIARVTQP